jgi:cysteine desulfurase/selenocysteine lyase
MSAAQEFTIDSKKIREDFPILTRKTKNGIPLVYLDSTATTQKPISVINSMSNYYENSNANIHRGIHFLAEEATAAYEAAREKTAKFINSALVKEIIFTRNATESINLVAYSWGRRFLKTGDLIILTEMEHHANLVPWQILAEERNIQLEFIPVLNDGFLDLITYDKLLQLSPKLVAFTHMSNVLGTINPAKEMIKKAHDAGALTLLDGAQSVPHFPVDVQDLEVDFLAFSSHKMCGPTGIGVLFGKQNLLDQMPPFMGGGEMIKKVLLRSFKPNEIPHKFEAGTPAIAEAIGLGAAINYLDQIGMKNIGTFEHEIISYALDRLNEFPGLKVYGPPAESKGAVASFSLEGIHPHDVAQILDGEGIAVRAGHHCAMPLHDRFNLPATTRASFYIYNTREEVDKLMLGLEKVLKILG